MMYKCKFCGTEFEKSPRKSIGTSEKGRANGSDQVRCPECHNLIPTWSKE